MSDTEKIISDLMHENVKLIAQLMEVEMAYKYDSFNEFYNANEFNIRPEQVWAAARELGDKCE